MKSFERRFVRAVFAVVCCAAVTATGAETKTYNVRDFGAVGDGSTKDTKAFQKALDIFLMGNQYQSADTHPINNNRADI